MKLTGLRAFIAAINNGSLRAAARQIGVSQPALTKMIRELERELAATLLVRSTTGVLPTAQGTVLYERALASERELSFAVEQIRQLGGQMTGKLTSGSGAAGRDGAYARDAQNLQRRISGIELRIIEELYIAPLTQLRKGEVDITLGPLPEHLPSGEFMVEPLMPTNMMVVVRKGSPFSKATCLADLAAAPWVYTGTTPESGYAKIYYERHGLKPPRACALVNSTLGLLSIIASGNYVGLMPQQIAVHPMAIEHLAVVSVAEGPLKLTLGRWLAQTQR